MDCCYGEYRAAGQYGAGWEGYAPYAPLPYASYAHYYAPHAHDPYARYYRYDYPSPHHAHNDHVMPMDYGAYASKEVRVRRAMGRRDSRPHAPAQLLPLPPTPPLECGLNGRGPPYCEPQMWSHYQMGMMNGGGWGGASAASSGWARNSCSREHMRYPAECRPVKGPPMHTPNPIINSHDGRSTPYPMYEESGYNGESGLRHSNTPEYPARATPDGAPPQPERVYPPPRRSPPEEKRPPVVPLPAFQQAFGSTEIGKFAEAFSRAEVALEDAGDFAFDGFPEWDAAADAPWLPPPSREIKCEDNY